MEKVMIERMNMDIQQNRIWIVKNDTYNFLSYLH